MGRQKGIQSWTASEISSFYVQNRARIVREISRDVGGFDNAEELLQEAMLYLLTASPTLSSEMDLQRYLKWKIRNLYIDSRRHSSRRGVAQVVENFDERPELASSSAEELIEQAEGLAVIRLALSRLDERQRAALVLSAVEERSYSDVGMQLGINANAARQLVFRARTKFRSILIQEADSHEMSLTQVLGHGSRKLATRISQVASILLVASIAGSLAINAWLAPDSNEGRLANGSLTNPNFSSVEELRLQSSTPSLGADGARQEAHTPDDSSTPTSNYMETAASGDQLTVKSEDSLSLAIQDDSGAETILPTHMEEKESDLAAVVDLMFDTRALTIAPVEQTYGENQSSYTMELQIAPETQIHLAFQASTFELQYMMLSTHIDGLDVVAVPTEVIQTFDNPTTKQGLMTVAATNFVAGDMSGRFGGVTSSETMLFASALILEISLGDSGKILASSALLPGN